MTNGNINNILIPNVTRTGSTEKVSKKVDKNANPNEFNNLLKETIESQQSEGIKLSVHAAKRLQDRNMDVDGAELKKIQSGIDKLASKGGNDSLLITGKGAYIVDVPNRTIVTAIDKDSISENVFTKIDSTVILN
jgi:flagellar operon protein